MPVLTPKARFRTLLIAALAVVTSAVQVCADPVITEFMASNKSTLADEDGDYPDWIEIYNPDAKAVNLAGWNLSDSAKKKNKWTFPTVILGSESFVIVYASGKNRIVPNRPLHTNFSLDADGEYLGLIRPDGVTATTEFTPTYPVQFNDISYGVTMPTDGTAPKLGYLRSPTPGAANVDTTILPAAVSFSRSPGPFSESFLLELSGAGSSQIIRYVKASPSPNGVPEPTAASTAYTGPIPIDSSVIVRAAVFSNDDLQHGLTATSQFTKLGDNARGFSSKLPVVILDTHGSGLLNQDGVNHPAWLYLFTPDATGPTTLSHAPALATPATMSVRGHFSANFLKKSFSLTLQDDQSRDSPQNLLGLDQAADWALIGPWATDLSYIRNAFVYTLSNRLGRWAPRTRFVETFVNTDNDGVTSTDYAGLAVLTDRIKIDHDRIDIASLSPSDLTAPALTGGYVIKFDPLPDPDHYNFVTDHGIPASGSEATALVVEIPKADKLNPAQRAYIRGYVQDMENALFAAQASNYRDRSYLDYIDLPSWIDHHLLEVFVGNVDALYHSDYFYKDRGGKLVSGPAWDFDGSMGDGDARNANWATWDTTGGRDVWNYGWWAPLSRDPEFMQSWIDRWQTLRRNEFSADSFSTLADSLATDIGSDAAARDLARWPDNASRFPGGYLGEVTYLKDWITHRAIWIDGQFLAAPGSTEKNDNLTFTAPAGAQLAYTLDGSDPRSFGGNVAPNAILASAPVTVAATANVHVRSYRADLIGVHPGTPWSSALGGAKSSPLFPRAKLINISSRAFVGTGEDTLIAGVTLADTLNKNFLARAVGPTLTAFGANDALPDPSLRIFRADGIEIYRNTGWLNGPDATTLPAVFDSVGAFPFAAGSIDSALATPLAAGGYTLQVTSASTKTGLGLVELYTLDDNGRTLNLSTRARVRSGQGALVGGFVVQGPAYKRMLIRAVGPTLSGFNIAGALADPVLKLYTGQTVAATSDDWSTSPTDAVVLAAAGSSVGAFALPRGSKDAALLLTLPPGAYTVEISGKNDTEGVALLEIYEVP